MYTKVREDYFWLAHNKRKARAGMCKAAIVLFAFALFSAALDVLVAGASDSVTVEMQSFLVKIICFFGVSSQTAFAAARMFVTSTAANAFLNMFTVLFTIVLPVFIFSKLVKLKSEEGFGLKGKTVKGIVPLFCVTQLLCAAVLVFSTGISEFLLPGVEQQSQSVVTGETDFNIFSLIMQIICVSIVVPLAEEYAFRGVVLGYLKRYGLAFGIVASALVFGISHATPTQSVYAFMFGIAAGIVTSLTGNIKTAVVLHMFNNLTIVLQENMRLLLDEKTENIIYCIFMIFVFSFAFYGIYRLVKNDGILDKYRQAQEQNDKELLYTPGMREIFVFPVIVYILIYAFTFVAEVLG